MSLTYKACNDELNGVLDDCLHQSPESVVRVPWSKDSGLNREGRFAAIAAIRSGALGLAKNSAGKYKLYYGPAMAGNWFAEVWGTWKSAFVASGLLMYAWLLVMAVRGNAGVDISSGSAAWGLVLVGIVGLLAFGVRGVMSQKHAYVSLASARGFINAAAPINTAMAIASLGAVIGGVRLVGSEHVAEVSLIQAAYDVAKHFGGLLWSATDLRFFGGVGACLVAWIIFAVLVAFAGGVFSSLGFNYLSVKAVTDKVSSTIGLNGGVGAQLYYGSQFEQSNSKVMMQTALVILVYVGFLASMFVDLVSGFGLIN